MTQKMLRGIPGRAQTRDSTSPASEGDPLYTEGVSLCPENGGRAAESDFSSGIPATGMER